MEKETTGSHAGLVIGGCVASLFLLYVLLPVIYLIPLAYAANRGYIADSVVESFVSPLGLLADRSPAYKELVTKEINFCGRHGLLR